MMHHNEERKEAPPAITPSTTKEERRQVTAQQTKLLYTAIDYNNIGCDYLENGNLQLAMDAFLPALSCVKQAALREMKGATTSSNASGGAAVAACDNTSTRTTGGRSSMLQLNLVEGQSIKAAAASYSPCCSTGDDDGMDIEDDETTTSSSSPSKKYYYVYDHPIRIEGNYGMAIQDRLLVSSSSSSSSCSSSSSTTTTTTCDNNRGIIEACNVVSISLLFNLSLIHHRMIMVFGSTDQMATCRHVHRQAFVLLKKALHFYEATYHLLTKTTPSCTSSSSPSNEGDDDDQPPPYCFLSPCMYWKIMLAVFNNMAVVHHEQADNMVMAISNLVIPDSTKPSYYCAPSFYPDVVAAAAFDSKTRSQHCFETLLSMLVFVQQQDIFGFTSENHDAASTNTQGDTSNKTSRFCCRSLLDSYHGNVTHLVMTTSPYDLAQAA